MSLVNMQNKSEGSSDKHGTSGTDAAPSKSVSIPNMALGAWNFEWLPGVRISLYGFSSLRFLCAYACYHAGGVGGLAVL